MIQKNDNIPTSYRAHLKRQGFDLLQRVGSGLSGRVFKAHQPSLRRIVAVKFFDNAISGQDESLRKRFEREAKLLARVQHPGVPYVLTTGTVTDGNIPYTIMEFVPGKKLRELLKEQREFEQATAIRIASELLSTLKAVHRESIVHRDICPENIIMSNGRCVLIDFSIGVSLTAEQGFTRATQPGTHYGRIDYMSPEQQRDMANIDERSDLYSVGVVLLEMLIGTPKFSLHHLDTLLINAPNQLKETLKRVLASDPEERLPSAIEFADALHPLLPLHLSLLTEPKKAVCPNTKCAAADWSSRGYYRGPNIYEDTTDKFCRACGGPLLRECTGCGAPFQDSPFCGQCGQLWYSVPKCLSCGSLLEQQDMDSDTAKICCGKGRRKAGAQKSFNPELNDDIPF
jgi:serine/threonine-protein kinase